MRGNILKAVGATTSSSLLAILIGAITNKLLSNHVGPEGIGLMGLFRNFSSVLVGVLTFGYTTILIQQVSRGKTSEEKTVSVVSGFLMFIFQSCIVLLLVYFFSDHFATLLFPADETPQYLFEIKIVIFMALGNILLQTIFSILKGFSNIKGVIVVQIVTALSSLVLIFPLMKKGAVGLALNVGLGSFLGSAMGFVFIFKNVKTSVDRTVLKRAFKRLKGKSPASGLVFVQTLSAAGAMLLVQSLIQRHLGMSELGYYNAAFLVFDTGVLVMMSSVRAYLLPTLTSCSSPTEEVEFFQDFLVILLWVCLGVAITSSVFSPYIVKLLFSDQFVPAGSLLEIFSLSLFGIAIIWLFNNLLLFHEKNLAFTLIDGFCAFVFATSSAVVLSAHFPLNSIGWVYLLGTVITTFVYLNCSKHLLKREYFPYQRVQPILLGFALCLLGTVFGTYFLWLKFVCLLLSSVIVIFQLKVEVKGFYAAEKTPN